MTYEVKHVYNVLKIPLNRSNMSFKSVLHFELLMCSSVCKNHSFSLQLSQNPSSIIYWFLLFSLILSSVHDCSSAATTTSACIAAFLCYLLHFHDRAHWWDFFLLWVLPFLSFCLITGDRVVELNFSSKLLLHTGCLAGAWPKSFLSLQDPRFLDCNYGDFDVCLKN